MKKASAGAANLRSRIPHIVVAGIFIALLVVVGLKRDTAIHYVGSASENAAGKFNESVGTVHVQPARSCNCSSCPTKKEADLESKTARITPLAVKKPSDFAEPFLPLLKTVQERRLYCQALYPLGEDYEVVDIRPRPMHPGFSIAVHRSGDVVSQSIIGANYWEPHVATTLFQELTNATYMQDKLFLDIGANIGWFSLLALAKGYRVVAFEPMQKNVKAIKHSLCLNPGFESRITLYPWGLASEPKTCEIVAPSQNHGDGITVCSKRERDRLSAEHPEFDIITIGKFHFVQLDTYLPPIPIGLLKIDVEGYEELALSDGSASKLFSDPTRMPPYLAVELIYCFALGNRDCEGSRGFVEVMWKRGYELREHGSMNLLATFEDIQRVKPVDAVFMKKN